MHEIPPYDIAQWDEDDLVPINRDAGVPIWSGKGPAPAIGSIIVLDDDDDDGAATRFKVTGYEIQNGGGDWLMALGHKVEYPDIPRDAAGAEVNYNWRVNGTDRALLAEGVSEPFELLVSAVTESDARDAAVYARTAAGRKDVLCMRVEPA